MVTRPKIDVDTKQLGDIIRGVETGDLRIPQFQREFVWEKSKVKELLDSMYHEYPIGSFFLWEAPKKYNRFFKRTVDIGLGPPTEHDKVTFILDGQQRVTSIFIALKGMNFNGTDYREICFDLDNEEFVDRKSQTDRFIPLHVIVGENHLPTYNKLNDERKQVFERVRNKFYNYPFSVVTVRDKELDEVIEIFQRINQSGRRLSRFDLVAANVYTPDFDLREKVDEFNEKLKDKGFSEIDPGIITQVLALNINKECTKQYQLKLETNEIKDNWKKTKTSIELAIGFLISNLGVKRFDYLPYGAIIPVLSHYFFISGRSSLTLEHKKVIEDWFWSSAFSERYGSASPTKMGQDGREIRKLVNGGKPLLRFSVDYNQLPERIKESRMTRTTSAIRNAVVCLLATKFPRRFDSNNPVNLSDKVFSHLTSPEKHHIFPKKFLRREGFDSINVHLLPNFTFIPADLNRSISDKEPKDYFKEFQNMNPDFEETMNSHLIPIHPDSGIWSNDYEKFIKQRAKLISDEIKKVLQKGGIDAGD